MQSNNPSSLAQDDDLDDTAEVTASDFWKTVNDGNGFEKPLKYPPNNQYMFVPDRICGDIPFHLYRSACLKPERYLEFLKELERSSNRHDFLFWVFDCYAGGRQPNNMGLHSIRSSVLNSFFLEGSKKYLQNILALAAPVGFGSSLSIYLLNMYPMMFKNPHVDEDYEFLAYPNTPAIFRYRKRALTRMKGERFHEANHDDYFYINPMLGLTIDDFPEDKFPETRYEDFNEIKSDNQLLFQYLNYAYGLQTFCGRLPGSSDCILTEKNEYKRYQVEKVMKKIEYNELTPIGTSKVQQLIKDGTIVVFASPNDSDEGSSDFETGYNSVSFIYKRVKLLQSLLVDEEITVLFVDYGEMDTLSITDIYAFEFDESFPKPLVTVVPEMKLQKKLQIGDLYVLDVVEKKYKFVGRPSQNYTRSPDVHDEQKSDAESVDGNDDTFENDNRKRVDNLRCGDLSGVDNSDGESLDGDDFIFGDDDNWAYADGQLSRTPLVVDVDQIGEDDVPGGDSDDEY